MAGNWSYEPCSKGAAKVTRKTAYQYRTSCMTPLMKKHAQAPSHCRSMLLCCRLLSSRFDKQPAQKAKSCAAATLSRFWRDLILHDVGKHQARSAQHSTAQHSTAQHSTAQHSTAQHSTAQHSTAQRRSSAAQRSTAQHSAAQRSTAQHSAAQRSTAQHSAAQRSTAQHSRAQHALLKALVY